VAAEPDRHSNHAWQEWVIAIGVAALSLLGIWTVFGDDLVQLVQPLAAPALPTVTQPVAPPGDGRSARRPGLGK
jgi:hypothetical protein